MSIQLTPHCTMPKIPTSEWFPWRSSLSQTPSPARSTFSLSPLLRSQPRNLSSPNLPLTETSCLLISFAALMLFTGSISQLLTRTCQEASRMKRIPTMPPSHSGTRIGPLPTGFGPHNSTESAKTYCSQSVMSLRVRGFFATLPSVVRMSVWSRHHSSSKRAAPSTSPSQSAA